MYEKIKRLSLNEKHNIQKFNIKNKQIKIWNMKKSRIGGILECFKKYEQKDRVTKIQIKYRK